MAPKTVSAINENWTQNSTSESPRKLREANSPSSTSGLRWRRSIRTNTTRSSNPPPSNTSTDADPQPQVLDCISASTTAAKPGTSVASPAQSSRWPRSTCPGGRVHSTIAMVAAATGRFTQKTQRQSAYSVNSPPTSGPSDSASIDTPAYTPIAFPRSSGGKVLITIAPVGGIISAAPAPWTARARRMASSSSARPQAADASAKSEIPTISTATLLNMSASRPPTATSAASASRYALTTHCSSVCVRSSSRWIDGSATLTTVASSIIIASVPVIAARISQRCLLSAGTKRTLSRSPSAVSYRRLASGYLPVPDDSRSRRPRAGDHRRQQLHDARNGRRERAAVGRAGLVCRGWLPRVLLGLGPRVEALAQHRRACASGDRDLRLHGPHLLRPSRLHVGSRPRAAW